MLKKNIFLLILPMVSIACVNNPPERTYWQVASGPTQSPKEVIKYVPQPMPGQLVPLPQNKPKKPIITGISAVNAANKKAIKEPKSSQYMDSIMTYNYIPGALYQIYCAPLNVTDIQFASNEQIISVSAGDTLRWQVSKTFSGEDGNRFEHLIIKPIEENIDNSVVITTNEHTYHLKLHSTEETYMASVRWRYLDDPNDLVRDFSQAPKIIKSIQTKNLEINKLNFDFSIKLLAGNTPKWMPTMVFSDGSKTYIQFPGVMQEAPTLFLGKSSYDSQIVNYRIADNYYIIDGIFPYMHLRGGVNNVDIVLISYQGK
jgi:type IV secretion system protein TrbG